MENMLPGNSFPQICVVSVNEFVENWESIQDYIRSVDTSNLAYLLTSNAPPVDGGSPMEIAPTALLIAPILDARGLEQIRV